MDLTRLCASRLARAGVVALVVVGTAAVHAVAAWQGAVLGTDVAVAALLAAVAALAVRWGKRAGEAETEKRQCWDALRSVGDFFALDGQQNIVFASRRAAQMFGYQPDELLGRPLDLVLPQQPAAGAAEFPESFSVGSDTSHEMAGRHKDGREIAVEIRVGAALPTAGGPATTLAFRDVTRNKRTKEMLHAREAHLRLVVEQMPAILWTTDTQLRITSTLGAGLAAVKLQAEEVIGLSMLECLEREDVECTPVAAHQKAVRGESLSYEMEWKGRTFQVRVDPLRNSRKAIIGTVGILVDVTDRKQALAEVKTRARQQAAVAALGLRALTDGGLAALVDAATGVVCQTLGVAFCEVLEFCPEEKVFRRRSGPGRPVTKVAPAAAQPGGESQEAYTLRTGEPVIVADLRQERRFRASPALLGRGVVSGVSTVLRGGHGPLGVLAVHATDPRTFTQDDVHFLQAVANVIAAGVQRRQAEQAQGRLVAILEATPDVVAIAGKERRLTYVNRAGREVLGVRAGEDVSGRSLADFYPDGPNAPALAEGVRVALAKGVWSGEAVLRDHSGRPLPVSQVLLAHAAADGAAPFLATIARDLSEHQRLEAQLRQAQKMEAVGTLAGGVAHDFNNMLCVISGFSQFLLKRLREGSPAHEHALQISRAAERAAGLTRQLLAFSRKQMLVPRTLFLNGLVADMDKMLRRLIGEDVELVTAFAPGLAAVRADPGQVEQILLNLAVNSRDAMPQGGKLTLTTRNVVLEADALPERAELRPGPHVVLEVSDTGCGMSKEVLARLFEPFFTTKPVGKGTGLGLATVYGIVKQSGGHIEVASEPGRGTTFRIYLPAVAEAAPPAEPDPDAPDAPAAAETVLLAEDEEGVRTLVRAVLREKGYRVLEAGNGEEALTVAAAYPGPIDLLLTDAVMPRMSGGELARRLRAGRPGTKVLFMSGFNDSALVRHGVTTGEVECLLKPFEPEELARAVRRVLEGQPPPAADEARPRRRPVAR